ncbi:MAG TPA: hypothetical protein PKK15_05920 [Kouleothrix sp.]|nr:hypothetical protein [Kouleothrix sp.]
MPGIGKRKQTLYIDHQPANKYATVGTEGASLDTGAPPVPPTIPAPTNLALVASLLQSAVTPSAQIAATWSNLETNDQETYRVQVATDSGFTQLVGTWSTGQNQASAVLAPLKVATTYYVRVQTIVGNSNSDWSASASATTPADTTAPAAPSGQAAAFAGIGDLVVTWSNPTSANLRDIEIKIWDSASKITLYATIYDATQRYVWTAAANLAATSGAGDPSLYVELRARSWGGVFSSIVTASATKAAPATPGSISQSWAGDTGAAGADWSISWAAQSDAAYYLLNINALGARRVYNNTYTYALDKNISDNGSADPTLSYSVIAVDGLNQSSASATGTATNAAPAAPAVTLTGGAMSLIVATITTAPAADFAAWEYVWKRDGSTVRTLESRASEQQYELSGAGDSGSHSWTVVVRQKDAFGQYSSTTTSSAVVLDALTLDFLRGGLSYSDSDGNTFTPPASGTLAALKDGTTTSGGVVYAA